VRWYYHGSGLNESIDRWRKIARQSRQWRVDGFLIYAASYWKRYRHLAVDLTAGPLTNWHDPTKGPALLYFDRPAQGGTRYPSLRIGNFRDDLEQRIEHAEREKVQLEQRIADAFARRDHREARRAGRQLEQLKAQLDNLYEKWFTESS